MCLIFRLQNRPRTMLPTTTRRPSTSERDSAGKFHILCLQTSHDSARGYAQNSHNLIKLSMTIRVVKIMARSDTHSKSPWTISKSASVAILTSDCSNANLSGYTDEIYIKFTCVLIKNCFMVRLKYVVFWVEMKIEEKKSRK